MTSQVQPLLQTVKAAARDLGISEWQVKHLVQAGDLPSTRIKNRIYIPTDSVRAYVEKVSEA